MKWIESEPIILMIRRTGKGLNSKAVPPLPKRQIRPSILLPVKFGSELFVKFKTLIDPIDILFHGERIAA